jgi:hypothetical protein
MMECVIDSSRFPATTEATQWYDESDVERPRFQIIGEADWQMI